MSEGESDRRIRTKICGVTNYADALEAVWGGVDALGFNLYPKSKRFIRLEESISWIRQLPPFVQRVAVMVNPTMDEVREVTQKAGIDLVQLHGGESPGFCRELAHSGIPFLKAISARNRCALEDLQEYGATAILLDAFVPGEFGGTGQLIDLDLAAECVASNPQIPIVLSGGLTPDNVAAAASRVRPYALDVASGVECDGEPRRKDAGRMRAFLSAARRIGL